MAGTVKRDVDPSKRRLHEWVGECLVVCIKNATITAELRGWLAGVAATAQHRRAVGGSSVLKTPSNSSTCLPL